MLTKIKNIKELYDKFVQFPFICTDTRKIIPNSIFFCLKGENFDGNLFVYEALEKGAKFVVTENKNLSESINIIVVDNVLDTLQQLAAYHRSQLDIPIIGITGTNGKTTTKELISSVLSKKFNTAFTQGNLNNHIGVPLTLLSITKEHEIAVVEMGANHVGEIEELCRITQPDYGIITNIGKAHLEGFGSIENIIETKTALYRTAKVIFVNGEDEVLKQKAESRRQKAESRRQKAENFNVVYFYGKNTEMDGEVVEMNPYLVINLWGKKIQTLLTGNYNLNNILAAAAIGNYFGVPEQDICDTIAEYRPQNNRSQIIKNNTNTIIADYYNANPTSMKAALDNFLLIETPNKLAILGDMLELGETSANEHQDIIDYCDTHKLETIFIGEEFNKLKIHHFLFFKNVDDCNEYLKTKTIENTLILIKGSRGIHLEKINLKS